MDRLAEKRERGTPPHEPDVISANRVPQPRLLREELRSGDMCSPRLQAWAPGQPNSRCDARDP